MKKRIIVSVISEVVTDQRVQKECNTLHNMGYEILVIGRKSKNTFMLDKLPYKVIRLSTFSRGPLMYAVFNLKLFLKLLFSKADILWANDLDTLLPNYLISRLKNIKLIYDSHEYFTESVYKPASRKVWLKIEKYLFPKMKNVITVNDSYRKIYEQQYNVPITVIRNVPYKNSDIKDNNVAETLSDKKILIIQGVGINENRGAEEAVLMMQYLPDDFVLYFIGRGTILEKLKQMSRELKLTEKIRFIGVLPYNEMMSYTRKSFLGLIFEKIDHTDEHMFALPNKLFDYMKAGIPVLSSKAVEIRAIIEKYNAGSFIDDFNPENIAKKILKISADKELYQAWKTNTVAVSNDFCWEKEELILKRFMENLK